jgi:DNA-binding NarL/FixJ family response regulator
MVTTVAIIEDNPEFLERFATIIQTDPEFSFAGCARNGADGIELVSRQASDVYLVDLGLPDINGIEVIRHAAAVRPQSEIIVITVFGDDAHVIASIEAGATGYILKDSSAQEIAESIRMLRQGGSPVSPVIARKILQRLRLDKFFPSPVSSQPAPAGASLRPAILTEREADMLRSLAKGLSFKEIGEASGISPHTVAKHVKNIYRKLTVHSRGEAVFEATKLGLIEL